MELTIKQALQRGVAAHKEGKLQEAERQYRAILQSQPAHPDANHNLGVLAVSMHKTDEALPLFRAALEANPKIDQFWLSYIDALIKEKQLDKAKKVLQQAQTQGVRVDKFNDLKTLLTSAERGDTPKLPLQNSSKSLPKKPRQPSKPKKQAAAAVQHLKAVNPSEPAMSELLNLYQNGQLDAAESYAKSLTQQFPKHQFAWTVLGAVYKQTGRLTDSLTAMRQSVKLAPQDAAAHSNLGVALHELKRLDEAEASCRKAIALKPDYAEAHSNLGNTLKHLGRLGEAEASYTTSIALKPDFAEAHINLGNTLTGLGRLQEAEACYIQSIALKPDFTEAHAALGNAFHEQGKFKEAELSFRQAIALMSDCAENHSNLGNTLKELGRFDEALASYNQAISLKPNYAEAHYNLGNTLQEQGRLDEAIPSYSQAIALKPDYAIAHYNLANTFREIGRFDEALAKYNLAITLKPTYVEPHLNLGNTLQELGRFDEALSSYRQAIALNPVYAQAHCNLGITLNRLGRFDDALKSYYQAIELKPDYAEAYCNLGITLNELGRLDEALVTYNKAISLKPDFVEALFNLSITQSYMNHLDAEIVSLQNVLRIDSNVYGLRARVNLAICNFLKGDFTESKKQLLAATKIQEKTSAKSKNEEVYWRYLSNLFEWHEKNNFSVTKERNDRDIYVVGESHSLSSHYLRIQYSGMNFICSAKLIKGCKQWHLGNAFPNQYKHQFERIFYALPQHSLVLIAIGEIDCRLDTGIIVHKRKYPGKRMKEIISNTIENYLNYIVNNNLDYEHEIIIQGVPCHNLDVRNHSAKDIKQLSEVIQMFNYELKMQSIEKGFGFLDTHQLTNTKDGLTDGSWHLDEYHLSPQSIQKAWRRCVS
jgi:tetratricopeptide (TPR) repeat protein